MNQEPTTTWHQRVPDDPMLVAGPDEFPDFLQLGIDFPGFDETQAGHHGYDSSMGDIGMESLAMASSLEDLPGNSMNNGATHPQMEHDDLMRQYSEASAGASSLPATPSYQQQSHNIHKVYYEPRVKVPLTPRSSDMQGAAVRYYHYLDEEGLPEVESYHRHRHEQITFTPLVSPAVTPIDPSLHFPDPSLPGSEYFTPLTSPAIEAQNMHSRRGVSHLPPAPTSGSLTSLVDVPTHPLATSNPKHGASRRNTRKSSTAGRTSRRAVHQPPHLKAQGCRRQASRNTLQPGLAQLVEHSHNGLSPQADDSPNFQRPSTSSDGSAQSSTSPEPLSEALMPPPAHPRSDGRSPTIIANGQGSAIANEPATPATLMRLPNQDSSPQVSPLAQDQAFAAGKEYMEDIMLPDPAPRSGLRHLTIDTGRPVADEEDTPTLSAKTPKLSAKSTPRRSSTLPQAKAATETGHRRTESRSGHGSKPRQSGAPAHVSPALRPKISPSIKPLVPNSTPGTPAISAETSALYLASKSNYQNILEGTHLPGVSYPEALAENLSSKRTSHKLAEQGRRNRINVALKEMEKLLPPTPAIKGKRDRSGSGEGDSGEKSASSSTSKASTVELAIAYIKALQVELSETKAKLGDREKQLTDTVSGGEALNQFPE